MKYVKLIIASQCIDTANVFTLKLVCTSAYYTILLICRAGDWGRFEEGKLHFGGRQLNTIVVRYDMVPTVTWSVNRQQLTSSNSTYTIGSPVAGSENESGLTDLQHHSFRVLPDPTYRDECRQHQVNRIGEKGGWRDIAGSPQLYKTHIR